MTLLKHPLVEPLPMRGDLVELSWETADRHEEAIMRAAVKDAEQRLQKAVLRMSPLMASAQRRTERRQRWGMADPNVLRGCAYFCAGVQR